MLEEIDRECLPDRLQVRQRVLLIFVIDVIVTVDEIIIETRKDASLAVCDISRWLLGLRSVVGGRLMSLSLARWLRRVNFLIGGSGSFKVPL